MNKRIFRALITTITLCSLCIGSTLSAKEKPGSKRSQPEIPIYSEQVNYHEVSQSLTLIGKLTSTQFVNIGSQVNGKVKAIKVEANQKVKKDQLLIQLDDRKAQASLIEAKAYLEDHQRKLNEYLKLAKRNAVTKTLLETQYISVDIAKARLLTAQAVVSDHNLTAPFAGTIGLIDFSLGKMLVPGATLLTLDDLSVMQTDLQIPETYLSSLSIGLKVTATSNAWPDLVFNGKVIAIDSRIDPQTLNLRVRVEFNNKSNKLKPGMMLLTTMFFPSINEPVIPVQALEYSGTKRFVYIIGKDNRVKRTEVILGARIGDKVLIEKGVDVGSKIVVQGLVNMRDGLKIRDLSTKTKATDKESN